MGWDHSALGRGAESGRLWGLGRREFQIQEIAVLSAGIGDMIGTKSHHIEKNVGLLDLNGPNNI